MREQSDISRRSLLGLTASVAALAHPGLASAAPTVLPRNAFTGVDAGKGVTAYTGIPYAKPPVGPLRFAPPERIGFPQDKRAWTKFGPPAIQNPTPSSVNPTSELGKALQTIFPTAAEVAAQSEDCLYLNVWTNAKQPETGRPVMVWLHGGGFATGSGAWPIYDGANLAAQDVVVVTLNHRLNVFGYADLPEVAGSGNAGMLDIVAALEWVRDSIYLFGGDPRNVTIFGESGGGAKVSYLLAMPRATGLFHRAIIQSGPGVKAVPSNRAAALTTDLYAELGIAPGDIQALRAVPAERLVAAAAAAEARQPGAGFDRSGFAPVVDGGILPAQPWDPEAPSTAKNIPVMIGINRDEMTLFMASAPWFGRLDDAGPGRGEGLHVHAGVGHARRALPVHPHARDPAGVRQCRQGPGSGRRRAGAAGAGQTDERGLDRLRPDRPPQHAADPVLAPLRGREAVGDDVQPEEPRGRGPLCRDPQGRDLIASF